MRHIDMHVHTLASDGALTGQEMALLAVDKKMDVVCVADHDETGAIAEFRSIVLEHGIATTNAMEATAALGENEIHILGYGFALPNKEFEEAGKYAYQVRADRDIIVIEGFAKRFDCVSLEEYQIYAPDERLGGFPALNYLKSKGVVNNYNEFAAIKKEIALPPLGFKSCEETIDMLKRAGSTVVLAHPSYHYRGSVMPKETLDKFRDMGIDGVECISPYNAEKQQIDYYMAYCRKNALAISGGSDCHGPYLPREMGEPFASDTECDILERLGI